MKVARSSSSAAYSASAMPLTTREPKNGGVGTGTSVATSERVPSSGSSTASSAALRSAAIRSDRSRRALRSASLRLSSSDSLVSSGPFGSTATPPRRTAISASISRRPSKASRA